MKKLVVALALVALAACGAQRAYNKDRTKSWTCGPNVGVQPPMNGQPSLTVVEGPSK